MPTRPVGLTRDLPPGRAMRATVDGKDVVVWRGTSGRVAAWNNRCPHRGMALSHGFVRGDALACLYHGWHFDGSGACRHIPAHPDLDPPKTIHTERYGVVEAGGVIWVSVDGDAVGRSADLAPLRTFGVGTGAAAILTACTRTPLDGHTPRDLGADRFAIGDTTIAVLCNPVGPSDTRVTVLLAPDATRARERALSRWCEAVRRMAETGGIV